LSRGSKKVPLPKESWPRGTPRITVVTVLTGFSIWTTALHSMTPSVVVKRATREPGDDSWPPAHRKRSQVRVTVSPATTAFMCAASRLYAFSPVKMLKPKR